MLGNPEWFARRKYGGWGLAIRSWQGWAYSIAMALPLFAFQLLPEQSGLRLPLMAVWGTIILVDFADIMMRLKKDEREKLHEAIAERNASWAMILVITIGVAFQAASGIVANKIEAVDPFLVATLIAGLGAKAVTNYYLERKG